MMTTVIRKPTRHKPDGFTIMELLVVVFIIALLAALLLGGVSLLTQGAKDSQTQAILTNLMGNAGSYEVKTTKPIDHILSSTISWGGSRQMNAPGREKDNGIIKAEFVNDENDQNPTYSLTGEDNVYYMERANLFIERFIWAANQIPQIRENLPALGSAFTDNDGDGFMEVVDPWGNPVAYANGVSHTGPQTEDDFLPQYDNPFFASAGQDMKWGLARKRGEFASQAAWDAFKETDAYKDSVDNLYSFDLDRAAATRGD